MLPTLLYSGSEDFTISFGIRCVYFLININPLPLISEMGERTLRPHLAPAAATCLIWLLCSPPVVTNTVAFFSSASAIMYSSFRILLPPLPARPELLSSCLIQNLGLNLLEGLVRCEVKRGRDEMGEAWGKRKGSRLKVERGGGRAERLC